MGYRTLEEKFIADYEYLEKENSNLRQKVEKLESQLQKNNGGNFILDTMVNKAGRNKIFDDCMRYYTPDTLNGDKGLKEYVAMYNNGEEWEDDHEDVDAIFSTYEKAVEYIESSGFVEYKPSRLKQTWSMPIPEQEYDYWGSNGYMFIDEFELDNPNEDDII